MVSLETKIKELLRWKNVTHKQFCEAIGITDAGMRKIYARNSMEVSLLLKVAEFFEIPVSDFFEKERKLAGGIERLLHAVKPYYAGPSVAGFLSYPAVLQVEPDGCIQLPYMVEAEFFIPVIGMSMLPTIREGDVIGVCHIDQYDTCNADRVYLLVTTDNERMIKRILKYDKEAGIVTLGSDNPAFPSIDLEISRIRDVYKVVSRMQIDTL